VERSIGNAFRSGGGGPRESHSDGKPEMPVRITLSDNEVIDVGISLDDWNNAFQKAVQGHTMVEIEEPNGAILSINPHRVVKIQTTLSV
jgi:hypothetical protein